MALFVSKDRPKSPLSSCHSGQIYARGDAVFYGSTGGNPPAGRQITGMALSINDAGKEDGLHGLRHLLVNLLPNNVAASKY